MTRLAGIAAVLIAASSVVRAEEAPVVAGSRVRVSTPEAPGRLIGTVASVEIDALVVELGGGRPTLTVPLGGVNKVEVSAGRKPQTARGAMLGVAIGAAPGFLLTFGDSQDTGDTPSPMVVAAMGAAGGAVLGAIIGRAIKAEQWRDVKRPRASIMVVPSRRGIAASVCVAWAGRR